jgi:hypothetical protein
LTYKCCLNLRQLAANILNHLSKIAPRGRSNIPLPDSNSIDADQHPATLLIVVSYAFAIRQNRNHSVTSGQAGAIQCMKTNSCKIIMFVCLFARLAAFAQNTALFMTFTNPTPAASDFFGRSVAAIGDDRVLVGASGDDTGAINTGAVYLFNTTGTLLSTLTNPSPLIFDSFGLAVAAVGSDRVLIGAPGRANSSGVAYMFNTDGGLLTTFLHPYRGPEFFGASLTTVGIDQVLIGAPGDGVAAFARFGAAYLFSTNGTSLITFTNPTPAHNDYFASCVAAVGNDRVLIGTPGDDTGASDAGAAYLFSTNGTLLTTFTNPTPAAGGSFGNSVASLGADRVLIGAFGATNAGAAYLFSTNGTLLTTFLSPTPAVNALFGSSVAAVGINGVLIGAPADSAGVPAYLFSTNGMVLTTFAKATPEFDDSFGYCLAAIGSDRVLIGAYRDDTGASDAGGAYLFLIQPKLTAGRTLTNTVAISWPSAWAGFTLQENANAIGTINWSDVTTTVQDDGTNRSVTLPGSMMSDRFYRLQR